MIYLVVTFLIIFVAALVFAWVDGITHMMENHPDYRGEDLFDEKPLKKTNEKKSN
jgi:hypothetical protein